MNAKASTLCYSDFSWQIHLYLNIHVCIWRACPYVAGALHFQVKYEVISQ